MAYNSVNRVKIYGSSNLGRKETMGDYITTYMKRHLKITNPSPEDIVLEDIAHALSMMVRANGHFPEFYSVAQHCIHCYEEAAARGYGEKIARFCLLHDASEAYLADITRPVKQYLPQYRAFEKQLQDVIYQKFLGSVPTEEERRKIKSVDDTLLYYEFEHYMGERLLEQPPEIRSHPVFETVPMKEIEEKYQKLAG